MKGFLENRKRLQEEHLRITGKPFPRAYCSGRSLAIALDVIRLAIQNEGDWIRVVDHCEFRDADALLYDKVKECISLLELEGFEFRAYQRKPEIRLVLP
jgi:hypothetical protein